MALPRPRRSIGSTRYPAPRAPGTGPSSGSVIGMGAAVLGDLVRFRVVPRRPRWQALSVVMAAGVAGGVVLVDAPAGRTTGEPEAGATPAVVPATTVESAAVPAPEPALPSPPPLVAEPVAPVASVASSSVGAARAPEPVRPAAARSAEPQPEPLPPWVASSEPLAASPPVWVDIPGVGTTAPVDPVGLNGDGTLEVPERFSRAGWYTGRPTPGETGPAIIVAHRASRRGPGGFWRLPDVQPGAEVVVTRADGSRVVFVVDRVEQHRKDAFPTDAVYGPTPEATLRLITCGGPSEPTLADHYRDNVIVFARLAGQMI